jgi:hypothetical protein
VVRSGKMVLRHSELNAKTKGIKLVLVHQKLLKTPAVYSWNIRLFTNRHAATRIDDRKKTTTFHLLNPQFPTIYSSKFHTSRSFYHRLVMSFQCWAGLDNDNPVLQQLIWCEQETSNTFYLGDSCVYIYIYTNIVICIVCLSLYIIVICIVFNQLVLSQFFPPAKVSKLPESHQVVSMAAGNAGGCLGRIMNDAQKFMDP